jgi:hypothetical protein
MTLEERIEKKIQEKLDEKATKKKPRGFKIPFFKKVSGARAKNNYVTVIKVNENLNIDFDVQKIEDQTLMIDKVPRLAAANYIMYYKKNPVIIQPSWGVEPFSPKKHFEESLKDGSNKKGFAILLERMEKDKVKSKKEISGMVKWILGLGLLAIIGYAFISGGI